MSSEDNIRSLREGVPARTPNHPTKSHMVKYDGKLIRFGEQGAEGSPKKDGESAEYRARREAWYARHKENIAKGPSSPAYWAAKVKW
jgi:hypothetical protein